MHADRGLLARTGGAPLAERRALFRRGQVAQPRNLEAALCLAMVHGEQVEQP